MTIDDIIAELHTAGVSESEIVGCRPEEVQSAENTLGHPLPFIYKEFLLKMGHGAGPFCKQLDIFYYDPTTYMPATQKELLADCNETLVEAGYGTRVPENVFFFASSQGEVFCFFDLEDPREDPPVYGAGTDMTEIHLLSWSFTECLAINLRYVKK